MYSGICIGGTNAGRKLKAYASAVAHLEKRDDDTSAEFIFEEDIPANSTVEYETYHHKAFHQREAGSGGTRILGFWLHKSVPTLFDALVILADEYAKNNKK